jgi:hypothetical protein
MSTDLRSRLSKKITVIINQPAGLGDIIWIQPIVSDLREQGASVVIPVVDTYFKDVKDRLSIPGVTYISERDTFPFKEIFPTEKMPIQRGRFIYLPLTHSHLFFPQAPLMLSKYLMTGTQLGDYRQHVKIKRDFEKENELQRLLELDEPFFLVNERYGTYPNSLERSLFVSSNMRKVKLEAFRGISLFDWIPVIEKAAEVHSVETSVCYLIDIYSKMHQQIYMYGKRQESESPNYFKNTSLVYRSHRWIYRP